MENGRHARGKAAMDAVEGRQAGLTAPGIDQALDGLGSARDAGAEVAERD